MELNELDFAQELGIGDFEGELFECFERREGVQLRILDLIVLCEWRSVERGPKSVDPTFSSFFRIEPQVEHVEDLLESERFSALQIVNCRRYG